MDEMQELSNDLVVLVARLVRDVRRHNHELPAASTRLLSLVDELGPATTGRLAEADQCSQPTMSGLVNGLVERDWLVRTPHPDDARASLIDLTDAGRATLAALRRANADLIARRLADSGRDVDDVRTTVALLRDLLPAQTTTETQTSTPRPILEGQK